MKEIQNNTGEVKKSNRKKRSPIPSEMVKIRADGEVVARARELQSRGRYRLKYENEFFGYLLELGAQRYEKVFLPLELGEDLRRSDRDSEPLRRVVGEDAQ